VTFASSFGTFGSDFPISRTPYRMSGRDSLTSGKEGRVSPGRFSVTRNASPILGDGCQRLGTALLGSGSGFQILGNVSAGLEKASLIL